MIVIRSHAKFDKTFTCYNSIYILLSYRSRTVILSYTGVLGFSAFIVTVYINVEHLFDAVSDLLAV